MPLIQGHGVAALGNLCCGDDEEADGRRQDLIGEECHVAVCATLRVHIEKVAIVRSCVRALCHMAQGDATKRTGHNRDELLSARVHGSVCEGMSEHPEDHDLQDAGHLCLVRTSPSLPPPTPCSPRLQSLISLASTNRKIVVDSARRAFRIRPPGLFACQCGGGAKAAQAAAEKARLAAEAEDEDAEYERKKAKREKEERAKKKARERANETPEEKAARKAAKKRFKKARLALMAAGAMKDEADDSDLDLSDSEMTDEQRALFAKMKEAQAVSRRGRCRSRSTHPQPPLPTPTPTRTSRRTRLRRASTS